MRLFIAIEIPSEIKTELAVLQKELRQSQADVSWTKPENLHLTLKFLGETAPERVKLIEQACGEAASECEPLALRTSGTGCFPNTRHPRVFWVGLAGALETLQGLHKQLEIRLAAYGFAADEKPFRPHLTVGRVKTAKNLPQLLARAEAYPFPARSFTASELVLMQSQLHPAGSIYTPLARAPLGCQRLD